MQTETLTQGQTFTISEILSEPVGRWAVHISDFTGRELQAVSLSTTTADGITSATLTQTVTRALPVGNAVIRVSYEISGHQVEVFYRNIFVYSSDGLGDTTGMPVDPGGGTTTFTLLAGPVDSIADALAAPQFETSTAGTTLTTAPADAGQFIALVFPAEHPPASLINTGLGVSVLGAYTLQDRSDGDRYIYTLGPVRQGTTFNYRITY